MHVDAEFLEFIYPSFIGNLCSDKAMDYMRQDGNPKDPHADESQVNLQGSFVKRFRSKSKVNVLQNSTGNFLLKYIIFFCIESISIIQDNMGSALREAQGPKKIENVVDWPKVVITYRNKKKKVLEISLDDSEEGPDPEKRAQVEKQEVQTENETN